MNSVEILKKAKALIENPANWTQGTFARDAKGNKVDSHSDKAVCFCTIGALNKVSENSPSQPYFNAIKGLTDGAEFLFKKDIVIVNDELGHEATMAVFDEAIKRAGGV